MRCPPYGRVLAERLSDPHTWPRYWGTSPDGQHVSLWVLTGQGAWSTARSWLADRPLARRLFLISPPDTDPAEYDWSILTGHPPILVCTCGRNDPARLERLCCALLRDGCKRVLVPASAGLVRYVVHEEAA